RREKLIVQTVCFFSIGARSAFTHEELGQPLIGLLARGDVALDADVTLRLAEAAAHREYRELDRPFFTAFGATARLARVFSVSDELVENLLESLFTEIDRGSLAF